MQASQTNKVKYSVYVRIRPPLKLLTSAPVFQSSKVKYVKEFREKSIVTYCFDHVFDTESTNKDVYEKSCRKLVKSFLKEKMNTTILAYGQTGSGKTYTLFGHKSQAEKGIVTNVIDDVFEESQTTNNNISCTFIQIYNQKVTDLISNKPIILRDNSKGQLTLENLTDCKISSRKQFDEFYSQASSNKIFGSSYVHNESSRSHIMLSLKVNGANLNIIDLCGSEVLTYQFDQKQRDETNSINLSLFTLNSVISDLCDKNSTKKFISFRNSVLTRLLKSSLVNTTSATQVCLFCNISPEAEHQQLSASTLHFGQLAIQVDQADNKNEEIINRSQQKRDLKKVQNIVNISPPATTVWKRLDRGWQADKVTLCGNSIRILKMLQRQEEGIGNILLLHAYGGGCSGEDWDGLVPYLLETGRYNLYSVDLPGFGYSAGKKFTSRAEKFTQKGEPIEFLTQLFKLFGFTPKNKVCLIGYDLGGAMALHACLVNQLTRCISSICVFHPTWTDNINKLAPITTPTLLLWAAPETLHLVKEGQKMAKTIKGALMHRYNIGPYTNDKAAGYYDMYIGTVAQSILDFLESLNPSKEEQRGRVVEEVIVINVNKQQEERNKARDAAREFMSMIEQKTQNQIYEALWKGGSNKPKAVKLAAELPTLDLQSISFKKLQTYQIWPNLPKQYIKDWDKLPLLPAGRQVQIKTLINLSVLQGPKNYLAYWPKGETGITHKACVAKGQTQEEIYQTDKVKVEVDVYSSDTNSQKNIIEVSLPDVIRLNSATLFRSNNMGDLVFEDSVTCKYSSSFVKLKMLECCSALRPLIQKMDFSSNTKELLQLQMQCTRRIQSLINLKHLVHEGIDNTRFTGIDVGKLAYYGQGNCHHLASVAAAFLLPFGKILGWDVIFRAGSFFKNGRQLDNDDRPLPGWDGRPKTNVEDHTWLQLVYKPSFYACVFDPSFTICSAELDQVYSLQGKMHIADKLHCNSLQPSAPQKLYSESYPHWKDL